jgi:DNA-binding transcriptional LysR family regulator
MVLLLVLMTTSEADVNGRLGRMSSRSGASGLQSVGGRHASLVPVAIRRCGCGARHLEAFQVLADERNFTRAAGRLHITQQALSTQVRQVEHRVGARLFERTTRTVALTDAGRTLLEHVPGILAAVDQAMTETRETIAGERGTLTVGLAGVAGLDLTPRVLRDFAAARPQVALHVRNIDFSDPSAGLLSGATDVALLWLPVPDKLELVALREEPRLAVLAADHPLAARSGLSAEAATSSGPSVSPVHSQVISRPVGRSLTGQP